MSFLTTAARMWLTRSAKPFCFTKEYDQNLPYTDTQQLGLYIHIPFCREICSFCPYCKVRYEKQLAQRYIDALTEEIHLVGKQQGNRKKTVTSLYIGGGSPALVVDRLAEIIGVVKTYFEITEGIGIELHPDEVTVSLLQKLKQAGVTKISIGIQSFQETFLKVLGRTSSDYETMFQAIRKVAFETVSMDFIFALPGQTFALLKQDIDTAFEGGADHIAIYPFIDFSFAEHQIPLMDNREKRKLLDDITSYCREKGCYRESIWTFSKHGGKKYSSMTRENFLGFGCSATTLLEKQFKINTFSVEEYIRRIAVHHLPTALTLRFTERQRMVYYLFWTAYTTRVSEADFEGFFGVPLRKKYGLELWLAKRLKYITHHGGIYEMTSKGAFYYHYYENYYTLSYIDQMWNLLRKKAFPEKIRF